MPPRIPASSQVGSTAPTASASSTPTGRPAAIATPPKVGVARVMPALAGRLRNELGGSGRGAKQRPQGERRDGEGDDRDDRVHTVGEG